MKKTIVYLAVFTAAVAAINLYSCRKATNDTPCTALAAWCVLSEADL